MKQKIIAALRTKYQRFGLSNEAIDRIASAKEKTVTSEDQIETAIADAETMELIATELQKSADLERRNRSDLQKSFDEYKKKHPEDTEDPTPPEKGAEDEPEWAKKIREQNEKILEAQSKREKAEKRKATFDAVISSAKKNGCTYEKALKLTEKLFTLKEDESDEDASKRFKDEYDANIKEYFGEGVAPYHARTVSTVAEVSAADKEAQAKEDAKRARKG